MPTFASDEWIALLDEAARGDDGIRSATTDAAITIEQVLTDGASWHVVIDHGDVRVLAGRATASTVTFTQDRATAAAIARGDDSAQAAFLRGDLRVGGDIGTLVAAAAVLDRLGDVFAAVRDRTEW
ncbi:MAG: SCP2 sterol-binding domain-containing protein [Acidimicrobiales bacterium]